MRTLDVAYYAMLSVMVAVVALTIAGWAAPEASCYTGGVTETFDFFKNEYIRWWMAELLPWAFGGIASALLWVWRKARQRFRLASEITNFLNACEMDNGRIINVLHTNSKFNELERLAKGGFKGIDGLSGKSQRKTAR
jgi:MFS superfamily sulfate permease-like transporter